jgi:hypothetical protein
MNSEDADDLPNTSSSYAELPPSQQVDFVEQNTLPSSIPQQAAEESPNVDNIINTSVSLQQPQAAEAAADVVNNEDTSGNSASLPAAVDDEGKNAEVIDLSNMAMENITVHLLRLECWSIIIRKLPVVVVNLTEVLMMSTFAAASAACGCCETEVLMMSTFAVSLAACCGTEEVGRVFYFLLRHLLVVVDVQQKEKKMYNNPHPWAHHPHPRYS